jgi:hypothetical protein
MTMTIDAAPEATSASEPHLFTTSPQTGAWWPICQADGCTTAQDDHPSAFELGLHRRLLALEQAQTQAHA